MGKNPRVNRYLEDKAFDHIDHALGRYFDPTGETHRNYFATEAGGGMAADFNRSPWWALSGQQGDMAYYYVTDAGKKALAAHLAKVDPHCAFEVTWDHHTQTIAALTPAKAKYDYFLHVKDVCPDLRFVDFARDVRVRRAA